MLHGNAVTLEGNNVGCTSKNTFFFCVLIMVLRLLLSFFFFLNHQVEQDSEGLFCFLLGLCELEGGNRVITSSCQFSIALVIRLL